MVRENGSLTEQHRRHQDIDGVVFSAVDPSPCPVCLPRSRMKKIRKTFSLLTQRDAASRDPRPGRLISSAPTRRVRFPKGLRRLFRRSQTKRDPASRNLRRGGIRAKFSRQDKKPRTHVALLTHYNTASGSLGRGDDITRGYTLFQLMVPTLTTPTAPYTLQAPPNSPNEKSSHNVHDLHHAETQSEVRNLGQREGQGTVPNKPSEGIPEPTSDDEQSGKGTQRPVPPRRFRGKSCSPGDTIASIDTYQTRRKTRRMRY